MKWEGEFTSKTARARPPATIGILLCPDNIIPISGHEVIDGYLLNSYSNSLEPGSYLFVSSVKYILGLFQSLQILPFLLFLVVDQLFLNSFPISLSSKIFGTRLIRRNLILEKL